jgi:phage baseplate assembly protein W
MAFDFSDFYIQYEGVPKYNSADLVEDDLIRVIIQKYQLILFTIKGEVLGDPDFGANLDELLYETTVSEAFVRDIIQDQLQTYVPEIMGTSFDIKVVFVQDPENYQDMMFINLTIADYDIITQIGRMV